MSIFADENSSVVVMGGPAGVTAAKRMAEFCHLTGRELYVKAFVFPPDAGKTADLNVGSKIVSVPIFKTLKEATDNTDVNTVLVFVAPSRATQAAMDALDNPQIKVISMITEGVPEKDAKLLIKKSKETGKIMNGPSAIGVMSAGKCRIGVVGGEYNNLILSKLYRQGSFGVLTKSGGLSNEIMWIISQFADGITTAIGIGGDAYPCSDFVTYLDMFENDPETKAVVIVGEMGGNLEEDAAEWYAAKKRRIKLIGVIAGFCQEKLPAGMKFGHAGAKEGKHGEGSARGKAEALQKAGAIVPETFGGLGKAIKETYEELKAAGEVEDKPVLTADQLPKLPKKVEHFVEQGEMLVEPLIKSTISDDRGEEPMYCGYPASELIDAGYDIPHVIGLLWTKKLISPKEAEVVRRIIMLSADHGPCVSGAFATIMAACAGIGLSQSVAAGLIMIGPRFGGAVTDAGKYFDHGYKNFNDDIPGFLGWMKKNFGPVPGIGHRVKSVKNPDKRVKSLIAHVKEAGIETPRLDFALRVEEVTTAKKGNLILNVDGCMAAILTDLGFPNESLNGFFILARTIGLIGHWGDQKRNSGRLIRIFNYLVNYAVSGRKKVPPLEK